MQDHKTERKSNGHLREPQAQAASGVVCIEKNRQPGGWYPHRMMAILTGRSFQIDKEFMKRKVYTRGGNHLWHE
jgi:hypothetical protein